MRPIAESTSASRCAGACSEVSMSLSPIADRVQESDRRHTYDRISEMTEVVPIQRWKTVHTGVE